MKNVNIWLNALGFSATESDWYERRIGTAHLAVNLKLEQIKYPESIHVHAQFTTNLSSDENLVVLECVCTLLELGYDPSNIELEPRWQVGHGASGGRADILVRNRLNEPYMIIECKTHGREFRHEWDQTRDGRGQLFSYAQQSSKAQFLILYSSTVEDGQIKRDYRIIVHKDDDVFLAKNRDLDSYRESSSAVERFNVWKETYARDFQSFGAFEPTVPAYGVGEHRLSLQALQSISDKEHQSLFNEYASILRRNNISGRENAFDILINLFLCKLVDEQHNSKDLEFGWRGQVGDSAFDLIERLQALYQRGMKSFLNEDVAFVETADLERAMRFISKNPDATRERVMDLFKQQKFYTNSDFTFLDVHNEDLFYANAAVLIEVVQMWQNKRLGVAPGASSQALGDMFENFLDSGIKQSEGQFFTPTPICKFILSALPISQIELEKEDGARVLDYACGSGHFLTEYVHHSSTISAANPNSSTFKAANCFGIEKEYRLSKVAKVAAFMHGARDISICYMDALSHSHDQYPEIENDSFDVLVSNPPFSVKGFLSELKQSDRDRYQLSKAVGSPDTSSAIEAFFLERAAQLVKPGGVVALILPESLFTNGEKVYMHARRLLFENFHLRCIVNLPNNSFGSTGTTTHIVFMERREEGPSDLAYIEARVAMMTDRSANLISKTAYDDGSVIDEFCTFVGIGIKDFQSLIDFDADLSIDKVTGWASYLTYFNDRMLPKVKRTPAYLKAESVDEQDAFIKHAAMKGILEFERMRLKYYWLVSTNGPVLQIQPTGSDSKTVSNYLGYKFSKRRAHAGIQMVNAENSLISSAHEDSAGNGVGHLIQDFFHSPEETLRVRTSSIDETHPMARIEMRDALALFDWDSASVDLAFEFEPIPVLASEYPVVPLSEVLEVRYGAPLPERERDAKGDVPVHGAAGRVGFHNKFLFNIPGVVVGRKGSAGAVALLDGPCWPIDTTFWVVPKNSEVLDVEYLYLALENVKLRGGGSGVPGLNRSRMLRYPIALPPLEEQVAFVQEVLQRENPHTVVASLSKSVPNKSLRDSLFREFIGVVQGA